LPALSPLAHGLSFSSSRQAKFTEERLHYHAAKNTKFMDIRQVDHFHQQYWAGF
jgi:hypothetical protein